MLFRLALPVLPPSGFAPVSIIASFLRLTRFSDAL